nr:uncharacterized protein LOC109784263 [Aegilops tauschii subsp. strangulata]
MSGSAAEVPKVQEPLVSQALVMASPPSPAAPLFPGSSASSAVMERPLLEMTQLREDLRGEDPRLVAGRLEPASGWLQSDAAVRATLNQAATASDEEKRAASQAAADHEAALKDAKAAHDRCRVLENELKGLHDEHAEEARGRRAKEEEMRAREDAIKNRDTELGELAKTQTAERGRLEELERKVEAEKVDLVVKAKVLAEDRAAFARLEKSHLHLRDPSARLNELLEPVADEHSTAAAAAVRGQVEALLKKFRGFASAPSTGGAATPAAPASDQDEGDIIKGGAPLAGVDGVQG